MHTPEGKKKAIGAEGICLLAIVLIALGAVVDATVIGKQCDGIVLVIEAAGTDRKEAQRVKSRLEAADIPILGVVLNKAGAGSSEYNYRKYGYGYGKDGHYGNDDQDSGKGKRKS